MKKSLLLTTALALGSAAPGWACPHCRPLVEAGIYNDAFSATAGWLLLPVGIVLAIGAGAYFVEPRSGNRLPS